MFHMVKRNNATIRELRTDFRAVRQRVEQHGQVVITDRGRPSYVITPWRERSNKAAPPPDYYARLLKQQPKPLSKEATRRFWEEERG